MITSFQTIVGTLCFQIFLTSAMAEEVRIAVGSNFLGALNEIVHNFEQDTEHTAIVSPGSSGKLYAQIKHGAPFDVFLSADEKYPKLVEEEGLAVQGSRFTYAVGRLTLWSVDPHLIKGNGKTLLSSGRFEYLALANPKTAPYGAAAEQTLKALGLWIKIKNRIVQGENIGQTFQFVFSKNAQLGFVALSQVLDPKIHGAGSRWDIPVHLYDPLKQEAVLLLRGEQSQAAKSFLGYVQGPKSLEIIERFGYGLD